ncbi:hypothetical protein QEG73_03700 [Chitinophagaceae bacterium 26-R-25]|nr:hypothetical protein [Chitinophagaceae bacterium 26-R-25]
MKQLLMIALFVCPSVQHAYTQETKQHKTRFVTGISVPELIHAGVTYRLASWSQLGFNAGLGPTWGGVWPTLSLEHRLYVGNRHPRLGQKTWFCRQGGTYFTAALPPEQFAFDLSLGKDLVFKNARNGISIDAGVGYLQRENADVSEFLPVLRFEFYFSL